MHTFFNLVFTLAYGGAAAAVAVYGATWIPALDQIHAFVAGAAVLLGGGLLHEVYARTGRDGELGDQMDSLEYGYALQDEELAWLRREVEALREALQSFGEAGEGSRAVDEVMAEVKVLKSLIARLSPGTRTEEAKPPVPGRLALAAPAPGPGGAAAGDLPPGHMPPVAQDLDPDATLDVVRAALRDDRVDLVLQPIVSLPQRKRRFYECFSRLRTGDGRMVLPEQYIALAERAGLITTIDNMLLFRCIQLVRKIHRKSQNIDFFCNLSPHTVADDDFFRDFVEFLEANRELAGHIVFEFAQADFALWSEAGAVLLDRLALLGCRFSLDQVTDLDLDPLELERRHVRFIKIEADPLLSQIVRNPGLLRQLQRHGVDVIVEKIEDEGRLVELLDHDVDYGQGFLFGEPRLARPAA